MRFIVFGAGAIGTYLGGRLVDAGNDVLFIDTPQAVARLQRSGLTLEERGREVALEPHAFVASWPEAHVRGAFDAGIFALKSYDTQAAVEALAPHRGELPPLLCVQNGVDNEPMLAAALGQAHVIAGTVTSAIARPSPERVVVTKTRGLGLAAGHALSRSLQAGFARAGLAPRLYANAAAMKWSKLVTNLMANATSAILDLTPAEVYRDARLARVEIEMMRECLRVMRALGLPVLDLPRTPVRALAAVTQLPVPLAQAALARVVGGGRGGKMPSFYIDLQSGRGRTEVDWLNGAVARAGARAGVPVPVNTILTATLGDIARDTQRRATFRRNPAALLDTLAAAGWPGRAE